MAPVTQPQHAGNLDDQERVEAGYIQSKQDEADRRVRQLRLTHKGWRLENRPTGEQRMQLAEVFNKAGPQA